MFFYVAVSLSNFNNWFKKRIHSARLSPSPFVALIYLSYKTKEILNILIIFFLSAKIFSYTEIIVKSVAHRHQRTYQ